MKIIIKDEVGILTFKYHLNDLINKDDDPAKKGMCYELQKSWQCQANGNSNQNSNLLMPKEEHF